MQFSHDTLFFPNTSFTLCQRYYSIYYLTHEYGIFVFFTHETYLKVSELFGFLFNSKYDELDENYRQYPFDDDDDTSQNPDSIDFKGARRRKRDLTRK